MKVIPVSINTQQTNTQIQQRPQTDRMDFLFENYDDMFTKAEKDLMNDAADVVVETIKDKGYSDKQIDAMMKKIMSAFEALTPKQQEEYVEAAVKFLANA